MQLKANQSFIGGIIAFIIATSCCWLPALFIALGSASGLVVLSTSLEKYSGLFMTIGSLFLLYGIYKRYQMKKTPVAILESTITCPECNYKKEEIMPTNACQFFYDCENCKTILQAKDGDCCVFCSYGTVACPPIQLDMNCCD